MMSKLTRTNTRVVSAIEIRRLRDSQNQGRLLKLSAHRNENETKQFHKQSFQPKNVKTAVKRFSCFRRSQPVSAVYAKLKTLLQARCYE